MRLFDAHKGLITLALAGCVQLGLAVPVAQAANATNPHHHRHHAKRSLVAASFNGADPGLRSSRVLILDQSDSSVLYARHADVAAPIASISKLLTSLVVLDAQQPMDEVLEITDEDRALAKESASRLAVGTRLTRGDLLHLALMASENRAAHALARNYPGGMPAFVRAMNAKARALGMASSHFVEPTGLSYENVASAEDLSKLVAAAARNPTIREYSTDSSYTVRVGRRDVEFRTTDALVRNPDWDIVVQKTGFINEAGHCLVMQTVVRGRNLVIVLLDSLGKYTRVADAVRARRWVEAHMSASHNTRIVAANTEP